VASGVELGSEGCGWNTEARCWTKACVFSALLHAHVPCNVRIGVEGCVPGFNFLVVFRRE
jgi:hypothetical protein